MSATQVCKCPAWQDTVQHAGNWKPQVLSAACRHTQRLETNSAALHDRAQQFRACRAHDISSMQTLAAGRVALTGGQCCRPAACRRGEGKRPHYMTQWLCLSCCREPPPAKQCMLADLMLMRCRTGSKRMTAGLPWPAFGVSTRLSCQQGSGRAETLMHRVQSRQVRTTFATPMLSF